MKSLSAFTLAGTWQSLSAICGIAVVSWLFPPFSLGSTALFALVILRKGAVCGLKVALLAMGILAITSALFLASSMDGLLYGGFMLLPVLPAAIILRASVKLDWALESIIGLGLLTILMVYLVAGNPAEFWYSKLSSFLKDLPDSNVADLDGAIMNKALSTLARVMTGIVVAGTCLSTHLALLIARWQQATLFNPGGFRMEFTTFRLNEWIVYGALASVIGGFLLEGVLGDFALNLAIVLSVSCLVAGFSIIHGVMGERSKWVIGVYIALFLFPQLLLPPITLLGLSDTWIDWRHLKKPV